MSPTHLHWASCWCQKAAHSRRPIVTLEARSKSLTFPEMSQNRKMGIWRCPWGSLDDDLHIVTTPSTCWPHTCRANVVQMRPVLNNKGTPNAFKPESLTKGTMGICLSHPGGLLSSQSWIPDPTGCNLPSWQKARVCLLQRWEYHRVPQSTPQVHSSKMGLHHPPCDGHPTFCVPELADCCCLCEALSPSAHKKGRLHPARIGNTTPSLNLIGQ